MLITPEGAGARAEYKDRLAVERWASGRRTTVLVRPDGYVAWAAESADERTIETALATHVG